MTPAFGLPLPCEARGRVGVGAERSEGDGDAVSVAHNEGESHLVMNIPSLRSAPTPTLPRASHGRGCAMRILPPKERV